MNFGECFGAPPALKLEDFSIETWRLAFTPSTHPHSGASPSSTITLRFRLYHNIFGTTRDFKSGGIFSIIEAEWQG